MRWQNVINSSKRVRHRALSDRINKQARRARTYATGTIRSRRHDVFFVIFGRGRSGSTLLVDLLNRVPDVYCDGELLHDRVLAPCLYVRCRESLAPGKAYGFKLLSYQLRDVQRISDGAAFIRELHNSGYRIIYLKRRNPLRQALSGLYARHRGQWNQRTPLAAAGETRMTVDVGELYRWLLDGEQLTRYEESVLSGLDLLDLAYERDLQSPENHQRTIDRVTQYLGIRSAPVNTGFARMMGDDIAPFISNYDEVVRFIQGTMYRHYLPSPRDRSTSC